MSKENEIDVEAILEILSDARQRHPEGSREWNAFQTAAFCLLYVQYSDKLEDFATYFRERLDPNFKTKVERDFATRAEADAWVQSGKAEHRMHIRIDGKGFLVVQLPGRITLLASPLMEELSMEDEPEE
ncbi:hypothetical protein [Corallococcus terminator]|uniref:Uncharacterized protein n=1 Tax=Corallococcus terminator TaxID=2316733 RepID=A0A3A8HN95_9BACT|nr:hypothetical protein [Corallococcus terminator]RKG68870.1 hypothetical protein D7V88_40470 [Corallococcus terminator]